MAIGKIDTRTFNSLFLNRLGRKDRTVLVPPMTGVDAAVIDIGGGKVLVVAEDPIFTMPRLPLEMFGWFTVHIGASDVAVMGVKPRYMTYTLLLPPDTPRKDLKTIAESIHKAALELGIAIVGGHTGYYPGFAAPTIGGITVFGIARKGAYVTPAGARPGNAVLLTKGPAVEAAGLLAVLREEELRKNHPAVLVSKAKALCSRLSVVDDALTAMRAGGVTAMHDATEGGVIGGLFEIAAASGVGMDVDENLFVYPDEIRMVCEALDIDPVKSIAEGSLLVSAERGAETKILRALKRRGIDASVIGEVTADPKRRSLRRRNGKSVPLAVPAQDPFWPAFFAALS
ncbi:MAG: AIR synthase family protein [Acidobacteriota bacterium]|nr:AIR synthase family protein [Acidobacteriota bacterium]